MREIKFRIWDGNKMHQPEHTNCSKKILNFKNNHHSNWIPMQFTGIRDKYGKEIYESDTKGIEILQKHGIKVRLYKEKK